MTTEDRGDYTVAVETLGCKLNQYESDSLATTLEDRGYTIVDRSTTADVYIVNSCTVTNKADRKSRNAVYRARRKGGENAVVILTGCYTENRKRSVGSGRPDRIADPAAGATYIVDNTHKNTIPDIIDAHIRGEIPSSEALTPGVFGFETPRQIFHTRTNLKVQDGCDNFCTFCIIPHVRGRAASRPPEEVLAEARRALAGGSRELVLTGVNMSRYHYRDDTNAWEFVDLVDALLDIPVDFRLRISSLEPDQLDHRFISLFSHPKMAPHLHLCAQSGSDRVLLQMRRMYTVDQFRSIVEQLRRFDPLFNVTTDIIVGFPGEAEEDIEGSIRLIEEIRFGHVHTFPYSVRTGTRAARMPGGMIDAEKTLRASRIRDTAEHSKRQYRELLVGTTQRMLIEKTATAGSERVRAEGLGDYYVPILTEGPSGDLKENTFIEVEIVGISSGDDPSLIGRYIGSC